MLGLKSNKMTDIRTWYFHTKKVYFLLLSITFTFYYFAGFNLKKTSFYCNI